MAGRAPGPRPVPPRGGARGAGRAPLPPPRPPPEGGGAPQGREEEEQRQGPAATPLPLAPPAGAPPATVVSRPRRGRGGGGGGGRRLGGDAAGLVHERLPHRLLHGAPGGPGGGCPAASEAVLPEEEIPPEIGGRIRPPAPCRCQRPFRSPGPTDLGGGGSQPHGFKSSSPKNPRGEEEGEEQPSSRPGGFLSTALPGDCPHGSVPPRSVPSQISLGTKPRWGGGLRLPHAAPSPGGCQDAPAAAVFAQGIGCGADVHPTAPTGPRGRRHRGRVPPPPCSLLMSAPGPVGCGGTPRAPCLRQRVFAPPPGGLQGGVIKPKEHSGPHPAPWPAPGSACSASPAPASSCGAPGSGGSGRAPARRRRSWSRRCRRCWRSCGAGSCRRRRRSWAGCPRACPGSPAPCGWGRVLGRAAAAPPAPPATSTSSSAPEGPGGAAGAMGTLPPPGCSRPLPHWGGDELLSPSPAPPGGCCWGALGCIKGLGSRLLPDLFGGGSCGGAGEVIWEWGGGGCEGASLHTQPHPAQCPVLCTARPALLSSCLVLHCMATALHCMGTALHGCCMPPVQHSSAQSIPARCCTA